MARPRALVVTTVHHADDTRVRERTIRSLASIFDVTYAAQPPPPSDPTGLDFVSLEGNRLGRIRRAARLVIGGRFDVVSLHDPELIPIGLLATWMRRGRVVFDLHEDLPAQILTKEWVPGLVRRPLAGLARISLRVAERWFTITLAEDSYGHLFVRRHPILLNQPRLDDVPPAAPPDGSIVYVGDVTEHRGIFEAIDACGRVGVPLVVVGPVHGGEERLRSAARSAGTAMTLTGRLPNRQALAIVARSAAALSPLHDIPNYRHSVPTKVLEYLAVGVPVVATDLPATRRLVEGLEAVELVEPGDAAALERGIRSVMRPGVRRRAADQAPSVRQMHSWNESLLLDVYRNASRLPG